MIHGPLIKIQQKTEGGGMRIRLTPATAAVKNKNEHKDRKIRPVSFSLEDPFEAGLNDWASGCSFSAYVKRLIWQDKQAGGQVLHGASSSLTDAQCHDVMVSNVRPKKEAAR